MPKNHVRCKRLKPSILFNVEKEMYHDVWSNSNGKKSATRRCHAYGLQETHVKGAVNIPLKQLDQRISEVTQDKNDTLHLYCNTGNQSGKAEKLLQDMGYKNAINEGGLKDVEKTQAMIK